MIFHRSISSSSSAVLLLLTAQVAAAAVPWQDLTPNLSNEEIFQESNVDDWLEQCVHPFADLDPAMAMAFPSSNYQLFEQSSGLCTDIVVCAYEECSGPFYDLHSSGFTDVETFDAASYFFHTILLNSRMRSWHPMIDLTCPTQSYIQST